MSSDQAVTICSPNRPVSIHQQPVADTSPINLANGQQESRDPCPRLSPLAPVVLAHHSGVLEVEVTAVEQPSALDSPLRSSAGNLESSKESMRNSDEPRFFQTTSERMHRRLASSYFVYFLCGWGDAGLAIASVRNFTHLSPPSFSYRDCVTMCDL